MNQSRSSPPPWDWEEQAILSIIILILVFCAIGGIVLGSFGPHSVAQWLYFPLLGGTVFLIHHALNIDFDPLRESLKKRKAKRKERLIPRAQLGMKWKVNKLFDDGHIIRNDLVYCEECGGKYYPNVTITYGEGITEYIDPCFRCHPQEAIKIVKSVVDSCDQRLLHKVRY